MSKLYFKTFVHVLKKTWLLNLIMLIIYEVINILGEYLFYDTSITFLYFESYQDMPIHTYNFLYTLYGNNLMGLQGYVFGLSFFMLFFLVYLFFSCNLIKEFFKKDITLLKVRTSRFNTSNGLYFYIILINNLITFFLSLSILPLINQIGNSIIDIGFNFFRINLTTLIIDIILFILVVISYLIVFVRGFSSNKILENIREIF